MTDQNAIVALENNSFQTLVNDTNSNILTKVPLIYNSVPNILSSSKIVEEQFKSVDVSGEKDILNAILNRSLVDNPDGITIEPHPFDFQMIEDLLKKFGLASAVVDKYTDYVIGRGIYIESKDNDLAEGMEKWMKEVRFKTNLKAAFKQALAKGTGFIELAGFSNPNKINTIKVINSNTMYIRKDKYGNIINYVQFIGGDIKTARNSEDLITLEPGEVLCITVNKSGNNPYGYGIIYSTLDTTNNFLLMQKAMHKIMKRKSNNPIHVKIGNVEKNDWPTQGDINNFGKNLTYMNETTEWVTGPNIEMNVLNFGAIGERFDSVLNNDYKLLSYSYQVPEGLLGAGNIAEGLANNQTESFLKNCQSRQEELEICLRTQIFDILAERMGKQDVEYNICFNTETDSEKNNKINTFKNLLTTNLSPGLKMEIERKIAYLLDIDYEEIEKENEKSAQQSPQMPPAGNNPIEPTKEPTSNEPDKEPEQSDQSKQTPQEEPKPEEKTKDVKVKEVMNNYPTGKLLEKLSINNKGRYKNCGHYFLHNNIIDEDMTIQEWVKQDYLPYKPQIIEYIKADPFKDLAANSKVEERAGYLDKTQIENLRGSIILGIENNDGLKGMTEKIKSNVDIGPLYEYNKKGLVRDENGNKVILLDENVRTDMIAKTEIVRLTTEGAMTAMSEQGIDLVRWTTSEDDNVCPECAALDGQIFESTNIDDSPPIHPNCNCYIEPVETQQEKFKQIRQTLEDGKTKGLSPQEIEINLSKIVKGSQRVIQKLADKYIAKEAPTPQITQEVEQPKIINIEEDMDVMEYKNTIKELESKGKIIEMEIPIDSIRIKEEKYGVLVRRKIDKLKEKIKDNPTKINPIVIRRNESKELVVLDGNYKLVALKELGFKNVKVEGLENDLSEYLPKTEEKVIIDKKEEAAKEAVETTDKEILEFIRKQGSYYHVISHKTGKSLGKYKSRAAAEKRLKQIQYFKYVGSKK